LFAWVKPGPFNVGFRGFPQGWPCYIQMDLLSLIQHVRILNHPMARSNLRIYSAGLPHRHCTPISTSCSSSPPSDIRTVPPLLVLLPYHRLLASPPVSVISQFVRSPPHNSISHTGSGRSDLSASPSIIFRPSIIVSCFSPQPRYSFASCSTHVSWSLSVDIPLFKM